VSEAGPSPLLARVPIGATFLDSGAILDRFLSWVVETGIEPYPAQEEALLELLGGSHVVLSTPTGSGKSLVALGLHFLALCEGKRSFYTAPIKALVSEKFFALREAFGEESVGMLTGDASINWAAPIICCTAEVLSNMALRQGESTDAPYVVMDEFHYYADRDRGTAWQVPLLTLPRTTFLLMSATLGNTAAIEERLGKRTGRSVAHVHSDDRPVPLDFEYRETPIHESVEHLLGGGRSPVYIVSFTQREAAELAQALTSARVSTREERQAIGEAIAGFRFDTPYGKDLRRIVGHGVGLHHAGLLPKYRLLVEQLSQRGLLKVICGTDTLGVGVNIPIRSVLFSKLSKYDGEKVRVLSVREFKQIAGRAGRKGFDDQGSIVCQAPEHVVWNKRAEEKGGKKKPVKKKPPTGFVSWTRQTFEQLTERPPEPLRSVFSVSHGMVVSLLQRTDDERTPVGKRGGYGALAELIDECDETPVRKARLRREAAALFRSLRRAGIVRCADHRVKVAGDLQRDFSLHQTLSLYLVEAVAALDPTGADYALDLLSVVEAVQENPVAILRQQVDRKKSELVARLKAERVPYEERMTKLEEVTYDKPCAEFLYASFQVFEEHHPWVSGESIRPKSVAREMLESWSSFDATVGLYGLQRSEGLLLRYLSQVANTLARSVPDAAKTEEVHDVLAFLRQVTLRVDSSLIQEWESLTAPGPDPAAPEAPGPRPPTPQELRARVRAELRDLVRALSQRDYEEAARGVYQDPADPWDAARIEAALGGFTERWQAPRFDPEARQAHHTVLTEVEPRVFSVQQALLDPDDENFWCIEGEIRLEEEALPEGPLLRIRAIHD